MKQLVSILIPAYNAEKWISDCIKSVLSQTWPWLEIIVVDDGSTDATFEIAKTYESRNLKVVSQEHRGASATRNNALSMANGNYIQWLDADDLLAPDKISNQMDCAESGLSSLNLLSCSWGTFFFNQEYSKFHPNALWEDLEPKEWLYRKLNENLWIASMSWLVSRRLTEVAGPWNESLSLDDDGEYFCRIIKNAKYIRFIRNAQCYRRVTRGISSPATLNNIKLDSQAFVLFSYITALREMEDSPKTRHACIELLNRWAIYFYPERPDIIGKMQITASDLGVPLVQPELPSKYKIIQRLFGWNVAKKARHTLPIFRLYMSKAKERALFMYKQIQKKICKALNASPYC